MAHFSVLHFVSDYFRNPVFRREFDGMQQPEQLALLRAQYRFSDEDVAVIRSHDSDAVAKIVTADIKSAQPHEPRWDGIMQASPHTPRQLRLEPPRDGGEPSSGWPGPGWVCIERVEGEPVLAAGTCELTLIGWNLEDATLVLVFAGKEVPFVVDTSTREATGRWTVKGKAELTAGAWSILVKRSVGRTNEPVPGSLLSNAVRVR